MNKIVINETNSQITFTNPLYAIGMPNYNLSINKLIDKYLYAKVLVKDYIPGYDLEFHMTLKCDNFINLLLDNAVIININIHELLADGSYHSICNNELDYEIAIRLQNIEFDFSKIKSIYLTKVIQLLHDIKENYIIDYNSKYEEIFYFISKDISVKNVKLSTKNNNNRKKQLIFNETDDIINVSFGFNTSINELKSKINLTNMFRNILVEETVIKAIFIYNYITIQVDITYDLTNGIYRSYYYEKSSHNKRIKFNKCITNKTFDTFIEILINKIVECETNYYIQRIEINNQIKEYTQTYNFLNTVLDSNQIFKREETEHVKYPLIGQLSSIPVFYNIININEKQYKVEFDGDNIVRLDNIIFTKTQFIKILNIIK